MSLTHVVTLVLTLIAFGMGLGLDVQDFTRIRQRPRPLVVGLLGQCVVLPAVATGLAAFVEQEIIALGLLLIAVCPGGASSNYMAFLARGDVALSVSLTAINSCLAVVSVPLIFNGASSLVLGYGVDLHLPLAKTMESTFLYTVLPLLLGMALRRRAVQWARRSAGPIATAAFSVLLGLTPWLIAKHFQALIPLFAPVIFWVSLLLACAMPAGYLLGKVSQLGKPQCRTLSIEIGVQNVALALFLTLTFFQDGRLVAVPVGYLIAMYAFVPALVALSRRGYT